MIWYDMFCFALLCRIIPSNLHLVMSYSPLSFILFSYPHLLWFIPFINLLTASFTIQSVTDWQGAQLADLIASENSSTQLFRTVTRYRTCDVYPTCISSHYFTFIYLDYVILNSFPLSHIYLHLINITIPLLCSNLSRCLFFPARYNHINPYDLTYMILDYRS